MREILMKRWSYLIACLMVAWLPVSNTLATVKLELTKGQQQRVRMAIVPFADNKATPNPSDSNDSDTITTVIANDLSHSGAFQLLSQAKLPSQPSQISQVKFTDWRKLGLENLLIGKITRATANKMKVSATLIDLIKSRQLVHFHSISEATINPSLNPILWQETYTINPRYRHELAHHIADQIYQTLTGIPGIFATKIAYVLVRYQKNHRPIYDLQIADSDGYNPQTVISSSAPIMSPAWSPDGKKIAYVSFENHRVTIYIVTLATGKRRPISQFKGINSAPAWSPDGSLLAVALSKGKTNANIYTINVATGKLTTITEDTAINTEPCFTANGKQLLFTSNRSGSPQIYRIDLKSRKIKRLTFTGNYNAHPSASTDGKYIIFLHRDNGSFAIAKQNLQTNAMTLLTDGGLNDSPTIGPNNQAVLYASYHNGKQALAIAIDNNNHNRQYFYLSSPLGDLQSPAFGPIT